MDYFWYMFYSIPVYNAALESETRIINPEHIEQVTPHVNVPVDPGAVDTPCCEITFHSSATLIALIDMSSMTANLQALTGTIDELGNIL